MKSPLARALLLSVLSCGSLAAAVDDAQPIPEPREDTEGDFLWWDGARNMTFYQLGKVLDLGDGLAALGARLGLAAPREAGNADALDEAPDSTWFTNRHHRRRLSAEALARGPNQGPPPAEEGPLLVRSGKALGQSPGFLVEDTRGHRYFLKFDPPGMPEMATGAELVSSRILHALGWNVPEYHHFLLDPGRLELASGATTRDTYRRKRRMETADVDAVLARAARRPDGRYRCVASRLVPGIPKGPFRTLGVRDDDPNDRLPHEDRRELRGLRAVAAWIHYTDARRGNFYDTFVPHPDHPKGWGHLEHYLLDFSSTLGSGNVAYKSPKDGHEYFVDPPILLKSLFTFGLWVKPWEDPPPVRHPALGHFEAETFEPDEWRTTYPNPLFDHATSRDLFWGARLVTSFTDEDLRVAVVAGEWSDPSAAESLFEILRARRERIAAAYFSTRRINPLTGFALGDTSLVFTDLGVLHGGVSPRSARYRYRAEDASWRTVSAPKIPLSFPKNGKTIEIRTSHDGGRSWSTSLRLTIVMRDGKAVIAAIDRYGEN